MSEINKAMIQGIVLLIILLAIIGAIYGGYRLTKSLSYHWWYEDMVKETVREMVKGEVLK